MKQHQAYLMLLARSSLYKILLLLLLMAAAQAGLFWWAMNRAFAQGLYGLEYVFETSGMVWVLAAVFVLTTLFLSLTGCQLGSRQGYTLRRLSVSHRMQFFWQAGYNSFCYLLLWAVQVAIVWGLCGLYMAKAVPETVTDQTVFLAFYRSDLLHSLLPLSVSTRWLRNGLLVLSLGLSSARFPQMQRRGKFSPGIILLVICTLVFFCQPLGDYIQDAYLIAPCDAALAYFLSTGFKKEVPDETA